VKLLKLSLKKQQEREIIYVIVHCALNEKKYNPYYSYLAQKFCEYDRRFKVITFLAAQTPFISLFTDVCFLDDLAVSHMGQVQTFELNELSANLEFRSTLFTFDRLECHDSKRSQSKSSLNVKFFVLFL
jgi:hypothetical protein